MDLIEQFKHEHLEIVEIFNEVKMLGVATESGRRKLMAAKDGLLAHLQHEDEHLYPVLKDAAEEDESLASTLDIFARHLDCITSQAVEFFEKYENGGEAIDFAIDFGNLFAALAGRIRKEENILYKEYQRVKDRELDKVVSISMAKSRSAA